MPGGSAKAGLALRLVRARHAAAAGEALYRAALDEASSSGADLPSRFDAGRAGRVAGSLAACRWCGDEIAPPRRTFCSDECVHFHLIRTSGTHVRKALRVRDSCVCAVCGVDAGAAFSAARKAVRDAVASGSRSAAEALHDSVGGTGFVTFARLHTNRRGRCKVKEGSFWQADHLRAVADGGGSCGLDNLRTLCARYITLTLTLFPDPNPNLRTLRTRYITRSAPPRGRPAQPSPPWNLNPRPSRP